MNKIKPETFGASFETNKGFTDDDSTFIITGLYRIDT